jgi:hypothetical protein
MTRLDLIIRSIARWWRKAHPDRTLERAIPDYARAATIERRARARGCTQELGRARLAKAVALHRALSGADRGLV